ncbi:molybdopterin synthase catalytic subunit MoaE [Accumulibacter sp.]|uniref:molybdopterin synthase catalytic subunit MoaE n=1 Tax=Accumulibacter sp. TaxID=2053492 RepID=UPI0025DAEEE0|nr:molybdopterin synthase catalytic subunit MoaE [Accumulibacter sp.]MCM8626302.1 molybdopterin synthase catalytic subunit MoaE [Accumulibacter sp.]
MSVRVQEDDFDVAAELAELQAGGAGAGALVSFVGLVRDLSGGAAVSEMSLEHYPGMTEKALAAIAGEARRRWPLNAVRVVHRVGRLLPGERIVFVGVASAHRGAAFAAGEFIIDTLKTRAPFWKREVTSAGARWVEAHAADDAAAGRWGER